MDLERMEALERLANLHERGFLTDDEFAHQKSQLLSPEDTTDESSSAGAFAAEWSHRVFIANDLDQINWISVSYGAGVFVCSGFIQDEDGTSSFTSRSSDGISWETPICVNPNIWKSMCFGDGKFLAVDWGFGNREHQVMVSEDGGNWEYLDISGECSWESVIYGNGQFLAISSDGAFLTMTSTDGLTWQPSQGAAPFPWWSVARGKHRFVAIASDGDQPIMTSRDGRTWHLADYKSPRKFPPKLLSIVHGEGRFVAVGKTRGVIALYSDDGISWKEAKPTRSNVYRDGYSNNSVSYGNGVFLAVGPDTDRQAIASRDGKAWEEVPMKDEKRWNCVTFGNGQFVLVGQNGARTTLTI